MELHILEFAGLLRRNGLRVSPAETLDAFAAIATVGLGSRGVFKATLRSSMVKRAADIAAFDELFETYFAGAGELVGDVAATTIERLDLSPADVQRIVDQLREILDAMSTQPTDLTRALLTMDAGRLEDALRRAAEESGLDGIQRPFQQGQFGYGMAANLGTGAVEQDLAALRAHLDALHLDTELRQAFERFLEQRLEDLRDMIGRMVRLRLAQNDLAGREKVRIQSLAEKNFYYLTEDEIRRMNDAVTRLAQRLKGAISIKRRRMKRGRIDIKATLRSNLQYGGVPFHLRFDRRRKERPQVVVLCDVSDSVRNVSRFMLQFMYSLQDLYSKVRSFVFVSELGEITHLFEENDINQAIDLALRGNVINVYAHSDFGRAFQAFHRDHLSALNRHTTVLILGDARNNYNVPHEWVLRDVQRKAKRVIWLNPESRMTWGFGDSEMTRYAPYCTIIEECRNLNQLYRVIDRLVAA
jgi:uncharacterized protein with von Willebrand factor type A (vWA) domain